MLLHSIGTACLDRVQICRAPSSQPIAGEGRLALTACDKAVEPSLNMK